MSSTPTAAAAPERPTRDPLAGFGALAAWSVLSNLMVPLAALADLAFLGHLDSAAPLAGAALATVLFDYLFWTFGFLRMGTTGLVAQAHGADDEAELARVVWRGLAFALTVGALVALARGPLEDVGFALLSGDAATEAEGRAYFEMRVLGAPATLASYVALGALLGRAQGRGVLALSALQQGTNVLCNWVFVVRLGWGAAGAGAATAIADAAAACLGLALVAPRLLRTRGDVGGLAALVDAAALRRLFALNRDILIRTVALVSVFAAFTNLSATFGAAWLASQAVLLRAVATIAWFVDGLAFATESLAGALYGAGDVAGLRRLLRRALTAAVPLGLAAGVALGVWPDALLSPLTDRPEVLERLPVHAGWLAPVLGFGAAAYVLDGYFLGVTAGPALRRAMLQASLVGFAPLAAVAAHPSVASLSLLWAALACFMAARCLTLGWRVPETLRLVGRSPRPPARPAPPRGSAP